MLLSGTVLEIGALKNENSGPLAVWMTGDVRVSLFGILSIALVQMIHYVVVLQESFDVPAEVVDLAADSCERQRPVGAERLEGAGADVEFEHHVLPVEQGVDEVV